MIGAVRCKIGTQARARARPIVADEAADVVSTCTAMPRLIRTVQKTMSSRAAAHGARRTSESRSGKSLRPVCRLSTIDLVGVAL